MAFRYTTPTCLVLVTLSQSSDWRYGYEICQAIGYDSGTVTPILNRLMANGVVRDKWEKPSPATAGRPRRRYVKLTAAGRPHAAHASSVLERRGFRLMAGEG